MGKTIIASLPDTWVDYGFVIDDVMSIVNNKIAIQCNKKNCFASDCA